MYNVMIVDDELIIREGISTFIQWEKYNCEIVYTACDGLDAISFMKENSLDIVITDIRMPGKTGLELAAYAHQFKPTTRIIILSGYSDFKYAQEALRQGAFDFILKDNPLQKIELAVQKAVNEIEKEQSEKLRLDNIQKKFDKSYEELKIKFYQDLIYDVPMALSELNEKTEQYRIRNREYFCVVLKIQITDDSIHPTQDFINMITIYLKKMLYDVSPVIFPVHSKYLCLVVDNAAELNFSSLMSSLEQLLAYAADNTIYRLKAAISNKHSTIKELNTAYLECCYCFKHNTRNTKKILLYKDENVENIRTTEHTNLPIKKSIQYIENNYHTPIALSDIADIVGLNPSYLSRLFKKETGESITGYLNRIRIEKSKELLQDNSLRLRDIAESVGFNDVSYFSNTFKKSTGISPTEYRTLSEIT